MNSDVLDAVLAAAPLLAWPLCCAAACVEAEPFPDFEPGGAGPHETCDDGVRDVDELCLRLVDVVAVPLGTSAAGPSFGGEPGVVDPRRAPHLGVGRLGYDEMGLWVSFPGGREDAWGRPGFVGDLEGDGVVDVGVLEGAELELEGTVSATLTWPLDGQGVVTQPADVRAWWSAPDGVSVVAITDASDASGSELYALDPSTDASSGLGTASFDVCCRGWRMADLDADGRVDGLAKPSPAAPTVIEIAVATGPGTWGPALALDLGFEVGAFDFAPRGELGSDGAVLYALAEDGAQVAVVGLMSGEAQVLERLRVDRGGEGARGQLAVGRFDANASYDLAVLDGAGQLHLFTRGMNGGSAEFVRRVGAEVLLLGSSPPTVRAFDADDDGNDELIAFDGERLSLIRATW